jgi:acetylglutamate/LysW-gamma-L-alpha-aminoadipate kinase
MLVLKFGGGKGINHEALTKDVAELARAGEKIVVVTGANAELTKVQTERGIEPRMITSERGEKSRYTDEKTLELLKEVYGGVAKKVASLIQAAGAPAESFLGSDQKLILAKQHGKMRIVEDGKIKVLEGDLTGSIESVNAELLNKLLEASVVVLTPPAITVEGREINVDGDKVASAIAKALKADKLIFFSNTPGLLKDVADESSLIREIHILEADNFAVGRMKKKVLSAKRAIEAGVSEVIFADGRVAGEPIRNALTGSGTRVF